MQSKVWCLHHLWVALRCTSPLGIYILSLLGGEEGCIRGAAVGLIWHLKWGRKNYCQLQCLTVKQWKILNYWSRMYYCWYNCSHAMRVQARTAIATLIWEWTTVEIILATALPGGGCSVKRMYSWGYNCLLRMLATAVAVTDPLWVCTAGASL